MLMVYEGVEMEQIAHCLEKLHSSRLNEELIMAA